MAEIIKSFARALWGLAKLSEQAAQPVLLDIYSEMHHPLGEGSRRKMPTVEQIQDFVTRIYTGIALAPENCVMALAYVERLVTLTGLTLHPTNWRRVTVAALLLASKVWEDLAVHNRDILRVFSQMKLKDLMELEHAFLEHLQFTVSLKASVYAKYYFELRTLSQMDEEAFPLKPLSTEQARLIEARSRGLEKQVAGEAATSGRRRSKSLDAPRGPRSQQIGVETFIRDIALRQHADGPRPRSVKFQRLIPGAVQVSAVVSPSSSSATPEAPSSAPPPVTSSLPGAMSAPRS